MSIKLAVQFFGFAVFLFTMFFLPRTLYLLWVNRKNNKIITLKDVFSLRKTT